MEPDDIAGLVLWLKADAITGLDDGDGVPSWPDSSGLGNDADSIAGVLPTYQTNELNSLPVVRFADTTDSALFPDLDLSGPVTVGYVGRQGDGAPLPRRALGSGNADWGLGPFEGEWQWIREGTPFGPSAPDSTDQAWVIHILSQDGVDGTHYVYELDSMAAPFTGTDTVLNGPGTVVLSGWANGQVYFGDLAEVFFYDEQISEPDQAALVAYLRLKWADVAPENSAITRSVNIDFENREVVITETS